MPWNTNGITDGAKSGALLKEHLEELGFGRAQTIETCTTPSATMGSVAANPVGGNESRLLGEAMTQTNKNGE